MKERARLRAEQGLTTATPRIAKQIEELTGRETRVCVPGHMLRGGSPSAYDRVLATKFGVHAAELIAADKYGYAVAMIMKLCQKPTFRSRRQTKVTSLPNHQLVKTAKALGVAFGD